MWKVANGKPSFGREGARQPAELQHAMHRNCLVCKQPFFSTWTGARLCDECRAERDAASNELAQK